MLSIIQGKPVAKLYHVIKKQGVWHLYAGNSINELVSDAVQANVVRAARSLVRHGGGRVVVHKDHSDDLSGVVASIRTVATESKVCHPLKPAHDLRISDCLQAGALRGNRGLLC